MILGVNDEVAAQAITEAARKYPAMNHGEIYEYVRAFDQVPVSRRQVALAMRTVKKEIAAAFAEVARSQMVEELIAARDEAIANMTLEELREAVKDNFPSYHSMHDSKVRQAYKEMLTR